MEPYNANNESSLCVRYCSVFSHINGFNSNCSMCIVSLKTHKTLKLLQVRKQIKKSDQ